MSTPIFLLFLTAAQFTALLCAGPALHIIQTAERSTDRLSLKDDVVLSTDVPGNGYQTMRIKTDSKYQTIRGFGGAFTDSTAWLFSQLPEDKQDEVLEAYFGESGHRYTLCRLTIGSTDFSLDHYNYDNTTDDYELNDFSIKHDTDYIIPMIKRAMEKRRSFRDHHNGAEPGSMLTQSSSNKRNIYVEDEQPLQFLSTPWSPPAWMKRNNRMQNSLMPGLRQEDQVFAAWARYFSKYISAYADAGVPISYVTVQNEPHVAGQFAVTYECCGFEPVHERDFLRDYLGPQLRSDHPEVKIYIHDDQKDQGMIDMVNTVMSDPEAAQYVDGVAFHWYGDWGDNYDILDSIHEAFPELPMLGTEATLQRPAAQPLPWNDGLWGEGQQYAIDIIRDLNHNAEGWIDWNMLLDRRGGPSSQHLGPLQDLGNCDAPIRLNFTGYPSTDRDDEQGDGALLYQPAYWHYGHFTRFIPPGSVRIGYEIIPATSYSTEEGVRAGGDEAVLETVSVITSQQAAASFSSESQPQLVTVVLNANDVETTFNIEVPEYGFATITMPPQSIQTLILDL